MLSNSLAHPIVEDSFMSRFLIADDHPLFRDALAAALKRINSAAEIEEASSLGDARQKLTPNLNLLLLDLHMSDSEGFAGLITIRHQAPALPVIVVSASEGDDVVRRAIEFGAAGYIPKSASLDVICKAISAVLEGDIWVPDDTDLNGGSGDDEVAQRIATLTPAQLRVLMGLRAGRLNKQIAYDMGITEATVKAHVTAVFRKLEVINRTQAVLAADVLDVDRPQVA
ncbi:MAG: response regulator transcription factor [Pseudomonadota bacterium]